MHRLKTQLLAAAAVLGFAALFTTVGVNLSSAQDAKVPDLSDLRDAVKTASKRGENVTEVVKALDALEKAVATGWTPPAAGRTVPPSPELTALRDAVEAAGRKGENVEAIQKELEAVEKAMTGQVLNRPKPAPPVDPPVRPRPNPFGRPELFPNPDRLNLQLGGGLNPEEMKRVEELMRKAMQMRLDDPNDPEVQKLVAEARELMLKALAGGNGGGGLGLPGLEFPNPGFGRVPERFRLGIRMERVTPILVEQLGLENGVGVVIADVIDGSVASKVGFKPHDIVVEFAGKAVTDTPEDLTRRVNEVRGGQKVDVVVLRKGKRVEIKGIEIPELPQVAPRRDVKPVPRVNPVPDLNDGPQPRVRQ